jgi:hypothetical protein
MFICDFIQMLISAIVVNGASQLLVTLFQRAVKLDCGGDFIDPYAFFRRFGKFGGTFRNFLHEWKDLRLHETDTFSILMILAQLSPTLYDHDIEIWWQWSTELLHCLRSRSWHVSLNLATVL